MPAWCRLCCCELSKKQCAGMPMQQAYNRPQQPQLQTTAQNHHYTSWGRNAYAASIQQTTTTSAADNLKTTHFTRWGIWLLAACITGEKQTASMATRRLTSEWCPAEQLAKHWIWPICWSSDCLWCPDRLQRIQQSCKQTHAAQCNSPKQLSRKANKLLLDMDIQDKTHKVSHAACC